MENIYILTGLIALLQLGCVFSQVTWENEEQTIIVREGVDRDVQIVCHYTVPAGKEFSWLPHLYKIQNVGYVEQQRKLNQEIDHEQGIEMVFAESIKLEGEYANILTAELETDNNGLPAGQLKLTVTIASPRPRDSGKYLCESASGGETFQRIHTLIVLPSSSNNMLTVTLSGMTNINDNDTMFKESGNMIYYGNENNNNPYGMIECKACDGASTPVITMMIGDTVITDNIPMVEEPMMTWEGDDLGMQTIHRCVARRHSQYQLTGEHNGKEVTCAAVVRDANGEEFASEEVKRSLLVYHMATRRSEGCEQQQRSPLGSQGQIRCAFTAVPSPTLTIFKKDGDEYDTDVQTGAGWSAVIQAEGDHFIATLGFDEVMGENYGTYYLSVQNEAGTSEIEINFENGQSTAGGSTGGVSVLQFSFSLIVTSLFLAFKLLL